MSWQPLSDKTQVARKDHHCIWCGEIIKAGQAFHANAGKYEGKFQYNCYHPECWRVACDLFRSGDDCFDPYTFERGQLKERTATK